MYHEGDTLFLVDLDTFEQIEVDSATIMASPGKKCVPFLVPGETIISVSTHKGNPLMTKIPDRLQATVETVEPSRESHGGSNNKSAVLDNGATLTVPDFVQEGDKVIVDMENMIYKERIK